MKKFKTKDEKFILEDTGIVRVHNYPPAHKGTFSYIKRVYKRWEKDKIGYTEIEGDPIYFHTLKSEHLALAEVLSMANNTLSEVLPREQFLTEI